MEELESQIAKIQLGNNKTSRSFVHIMAERAPGSPAELYMVAELPLLNPAAEEDCERICLAIASALKRSFRRPGPENSFENAISQINDELGKLASMGQTEWIYKLNCILAAKENDDFQDGLKGTTHRTGSRLLDHAGYFVQSAIDGIAGAIAWHGYRADGNGAMLIQVRIGLLSHSREVMP